MTKQTCRHFWRRPLVFPPLVLQRKKCYTMTGEEAVYRQVSMHLGEELAMYKSKCESLKQDNDLLNKIHTNKRKHKETEAKLRHAEATNASLSEHMETKNKMIKRIKSQVTYAEKMSKKVSQLEQTGEKIKETDEVLYSQMNILENQQRELKDIQDENDWLRELAEETIQTVYDRGLFTDKMKECVFKLLKYNVPTGQISSVIESVLELADRKPSDLPTKSTINEWNIIRLCLSQRQIAEEIPKTKSLGLLSDEISKFDKKYEGIHVSDEEGNIYVLGLRNIASKSGQDTLQTL